MTAILRSAPQRALFRVYGAFFLYQRWSRRRFTLAGYAVLSGAVLCAALGVDTRHTMAFEAFAFLAALLLVSGVLGLRRPPALELSMEAPRWAEAGLPFGLVIRITNPAERAEEGLQIRLEMPDPRPDFDSFRRARDPRRVNAYDRALGFYRYAQLLHEKRNADHVTVTLEPLPPHAMVQTRLAVTPYRRGPLHLSGASVLRPDPLGLMRAARFVAAPARILVLPHRYRLPRILFPGAQHDTQGELPPEARTGNSDEFHSLREYRPGDPLARVHWKRYARLGRPVVREQQDEAASRYALLLDNCVPPDGAAAFEEAISIAASFACTLESGECLLERLLAEGSSGIESAIGPSVSGAAPEILLAALACMQPSVSHGLAPLQQAARRLRTPQAGVIAILLTWDADRRALVNALRASGARVTVLVVSCERPADLPGDAHYLVPGRIEEGLARLD